MATVFDVANYVLKNKGKMTTLKLQKLVFYCQAYSLAWDGVPLFSADFQAWANGPVCPQLFSSHKGMFEVSSDKYKSYCEAFSDEAIETMNIVLDVYGDKSPGWLKDLSHEEFPWKNARKGYAPGDPCHVVIEKEIMQEYYGKSEE